MTTATKTAADSVQAQAVAIQWAIMLLQKSLDDLTAEVNPDTTRWQDVAKFAHVADLARHVVDAYEGE